MDGNDQGSSKKGMASSFHLRLDNDTRTRFRQLAASHGIRESEMLRKIIIASLKQAGERETAMQIPQNASTAIKRRSISLPEFMMDEARLRAAEVGMMAGRWMSALIQSNLLKYPVLPYEELCTLKETNRELAAIGRNLNQFVRLMHTREDEFDRIRLEHITQVRELIHEVRTNLDALIRSSQNQWEASHDGSG